MKITALTLSLTFAGFLHFDCALSADVFEIEMSNNHNITGVLVPTQEDAFWVTKQRNKEYFQTYEVFVRTFQGTHMVSASIAPRETMPGHNPPEEFPKSAELNIWGQELLTDGIFHPYDPFAPPTFLHRRDYIFVAVAKRKKIFYALLKQKNPINTLFPLPIINAINKKRAAEESSKRPRNV